MSQEQEQEEEQEEPHLNFTLQEVFTGLYIRERERVGVWRVSGRCLEGFWKLSGRCLEGVWKVS